MLTKVVFTLSKVLGIEKKLENLCNIVKYYCNLKQVFSIRIHLKT